MDKHEEIKEIEKKFFISYREAKDFWKTYKKGTIRLFHGTTSDCLVGIQLEGIKPREMTGLNNWKKMPSHEENVYLTDRWQYFYAFNSWSGKSKEELKKTVPIYIEVEVDVKNLMPDEDFVFTKYIKEKADKILRKKEDNIPISFLECLNFYGTCAYHGIIRPENIVSVTIIGNPKFLLELMDKESEYMKEWKTIRVNGVGGKNKILDLMMKEGNSKYISTYWFENYKKNSPNGEFISNDRMIVGFRPSDKEEGMVQAFTSPKKEVMKDG